MRTFRPIHGMILIALFMAGVLSASYVFDGGARRSDHDTVKPDRDGLVRIDLAGLGTPGVRFYHFINTGNQEVDFFVARDESGALTVAFDANEICFRKGRGYRAEGEWVVCNACDKAFRLADLGEGGGCKPVPLEFQAQGDEVVLAESEVLRGWRLFR